MDTQHQIVEPLLREPVTPDLPAWSRMLRERREAAGLTRAGLAARAGISETTIKNLETGRHPPTRSSLLRLLSVPELRLDSSDTAGGLGAEPLPPTLAKDSEG